MVNKIARIVADFALMAICAAVLAGLIAGTAHVLQWAFP